MSTEELQRHWSGPAERKRAWPPITVVVGVISLLGAGVWIAALTPPSPSLTVEFPQTWGSLLFSVALVVGTLLGVRTLWVIHVVTSAVVLGLVVGSAFQDPQAQSIGGSLLLIIGLVCLLRPSARQFEQRRVRVVLD
jgi:hypothetical protein